MLASRHFLELLNDPFCKYTLVGSKYVMFMNDETFFFLIILCNVNSHVQTATHSNA